MKKAQAQILPRAHRGINELKEATNKCEDRSENARKEEKRFMSRKVVEKKARKRLKNKRNAR
jgi:hypothetical protein